MKSRARLNVEIASFGSFLPDRVLTNQDLAKMVDTSDEWITQRTGVKERRISSEDQATSDLAIPAARQALEKAGMSGKDMDMILVGTSTPDYMFPATACLVQAAIGAENAACYDVSSACTGFMSVLVQGAVFVAGGHCETVMVIGADALTKFVDYTDRRSCILFGDGAGAVILRRSCNGGEVLYVEMGSDGSRPEVLFFPGSGSRMRLSTDIRSENGPFFELQGREVFKCAVNKLGELVLRIPDETGIPLSSIKAIIPHQSNERIIRSVCERGGIDAQKAYMNIDRVGNTTCASIPIAFREAVDKGLVARGDLVLLLAFGGGLTWASMLLRY